MTDLYSNSQIFVRKTPHHPDHDCKVRITTSDTPLVSCVKLIKHIKYMLYKYIINITKDLMSSYASFIKFIELLNHNIYVLENFKHISVK